MSGGQGGTGDLVLVSACLAGVHCRHDGGSKPHPKALRLLEEGRALPLCPEELGGLGTPRPAAWFYGEGEGGDEDGSSVREGRGRRVDERGRDVTDAYLRGARETLGRARAVGCRRALLKEGSPSCGLRRVHRSVNRRSVDRREGGEGPGVGVTAALLAREGFELETEED
ncbi:MAG: DUF523 domain-containing protein [Nitrospinota bacterium]